MTRVDRVTCHESLRLLNDYIDRELDPREQGLVEAHLKICESCAQNFHFEAGVVRQLREKIQRIDVPADLMANVLQRLRDNE